MRHVSSVSIPRSADTAHLFSDQIEGVNPSDAFRQIHTLAEMQEPSEMTETPVPPQRGKKRNK